jgi:hypothetical protein
MFVLVRKISWILDIGVREAWAPESGCSEVQDEV